jgi:hypothetical protein
VIVAENGKIGLKLYAGLSSAHFPTPSHASIFKRSQTETKETPPLGERGEASSDLLGGSSLGFLTPLANIYQRTIAVASELAGGDWEPVKVGKV